MKYFLKIRARLLTVIIGLMLTLSLAQATTYYTFANGSPSATASWWTATNGTGTHPANFTKAGDIFIIQSPNNMTTTANWAVTGTVTINSGGTLTTSTNRTLTVGTLNVDGTYTNGSTGSVTITNLAVGSTGIYNHTSTSAILPKGSTSTTWDAASNLNITRAFTSATVITNFIGQTFGNVTFNPSSMTNTVCLFGASGSVTVNNFTVSSTRSSTLYMRQSGQQFVGVLNINGSLTISAGIFDMHNGGATPTISAINLKGNFTLSGTSTLKQTTTQTGSKVNFNFIGTGTQTVSISSSAFITSQATTASCAIQFNVASGATIDMGTSVLKGTNNTSFTLSAGGGITTANTGGLSASGATGSIQVAGPRTYFPTANYTYNSLVAGQVTGNGVTAANNLNISNTNAGVTFSNAIAVSGNMSVATSAHANLGTFISTAASLTLGGTIQTNGLSYGGTGAPAGVTLNSTFFNNNTGQLNVALAAPSNLSYSSPYSFPVGVSITPQYPTVTGSVTSYAIVPSLSTGLAFDTSTGAITGTPAASPSANYVVTATNTAGTTTCTVVISVGDYRYAVADAAWDLTTTWAATSGGTAGASVPVSGTIVFIGEASARTVTIPAGVAAVCGNLTMGNYSAATAATLTMAGAGSSLSVGHDLVMNRPNATATSAINVNVGTLTVEGQLMLANSDLTPNSSASLINQVNITTGTVTTRDLMFNGQAAAQSAVVFTGAGTLNISGDLTFGYILGTLTPSTGTVNFTGAAQTVPYISSVTYNNLGLSGSGTKTLSASMTSVNNLTLSGTAGAATLANLAIGGALTVGTGTTFTTGTNFTLGVTGTTSVTGTLTLAGTGDKTFTGDVTVNAGGVWNETGIAVINYAGSLANNGTTFTALSGVHTFSGTSKTISGTSEISIANVAVTGTYTNSGTLTISTALSGAGGLTNGNGTIGTLNLGGTSVITTLTTTATGNTVNYTGAAQTVRSNNYYNLILSGSGADVLQTGTTAIGGNLTLGGTVSATTVVGLAITGNLNIGNGTTFTAAAFPLTVTGTTTVGGGASGNLTISSATGAKLFTGLVTIASGATWNNSGNSDLEFRGGITSTPAFTGGSGVHTFTTNAQALTGTFTIPSVTVTGITLTNNNSLTVATALEGTGGLTQAASANLLIGGTSGITTLTATATGNLVNYNGPAQTVYPTTYYNLTLSGTLAKTFPAGTTTVTNILSMEGTATTTVTGTLTYGSSATLQYKGSSAQTTGGEFPATWAGTGGVKIENTSGVTLNAIKTFTSPAPLNIGSSIANSLFSDGGFQITATGGIFHLTSGTFKLGSGASGSSFPGFTTVTIDAGTTVEYAATAAQTVKVISYENLTISGSGAKTAANNITVNGILYLNSANASATVGCLDMGAAYTLNMGATATTTGTGDVTGIVRRASFALNTPYTFGNQFTTLTITAGKLPSWVSAKIVLPGTALFPNAITRYYDFSQSGGDATTLVTLNLHYLPGTYPSGEFTGTASLSNLDVYDWDVGGSQEDKGHSNGSTTDLWLGLANQTLDYITPTGAFGTKYWTLGARSLIDYTWLGLTDNTWATTTNWVGGNVPGPGNHAIITDATGTNNDPTLPATTTIGSITINLGGILNGGTGTVLSLDGTTNAWENLAGVSGFVAGTSTVKFTAAGATMADPTNFYNVDVANGASLTLGTNNIMRIAGALTLTGTGVLNAASNHNTVEYNGTTATQTVVNPNGSTTGYHNLILSGSTSKTMPSTAMTVYGDLETSGTASATAGNALTLAGNVILGTGTTFNGSTFSHTVSGNWTNNGATYTPGTGTVTLNNTTAAQAINGSATSQAFYNLVIDKSTQTLSVGGSTTTLTVNDLTETSGNFTAPATLNVNGNATLTAGTFTGGATTTITGNATLTAGTFSAGATTNITGNATLTAGTFTAGAATNIAGNWSRAIASTFSNSGGTVTFNGSSAQTIGGTASTTFHNLTINNNAGATSTIDQYVNGVLNLQSANPSAAKGSLSMPDPFKLYMGASATTTGPGDVSGYITRTSFALGTPYTFGSQYTLMNFAVGPLPSSVTLEVYLANPSTWKSNAINRYYDVTQIGGTADTRLRFNAHYLNSELNSNTDGNLDLFDHHVLGTYAGQTHDHGRTDFSNASNAEWVGFSNVGLVFLGVDTPDDHLWTLGNNTTGSTSTWIGGSPSGPTDWNLPGNWEGGVPGTTSDVHIPATAYAPVLPNGTTTILSVEVQSGGILNASNGTPALTITGGTDAWLSSGTFNAGNSTVTFTNAAATIGGTTGFNNITVETGAKLTPGAGSTMIIGGTFTRTGTFDAYTNSNTVEYNGSGQTVINPNGTSPGYQNLVLSGSGSKTLPAETMLVQGSFTLSGSASVTVNNPVTVTGMTTISGTSNLILGSTGTDKLSNTGAITLNGGTFTAGYTETVGTLNLSDNSSIALGTGNHTLTFAASNGVSWTEGKMITISGWTGTIVGSGNEGKISVSSATGLTANQLSQVKFYIVSTYNNSTILGSEVVPTATWTWTGTTSSDWSVAGNWSAGVPPSGADIVIADVTNNPIVSTAVLFNNLTINSGGLLTITSSGAVTVNGTLTVTGTDGLIVNSDESSNGSLIVLGSSTGEITYNRYMLGGRWYIVSSPVNIISQSIGSWLPLSGVSIANGVYGMTTYKESTNTWDSYYTASASDGFVAGQGYLMRKDANGTIAFTGTLNADPVSTTIGRTTTGWNSVGNPFTSPISGNSGTASIENFITKNTGELDPSHIAIYYWDESGGYSGASYKIINNTGAAAYLQAGQGFLVKSKYGGVSLTFSNSMCYAQNSQVLRSVTVSSWSSLVLQAASVGKTKTTTIDFRSDMTTGLDPTYDAGIYKSDPNFELYTRLVDDNGIDFAIQCLPTDVWKTLSIPVGIDLPLGGEVIFSLSSIDIPTGYYPLLTDKLLNTSTYLKTTADNYTVTLPANTSGAGRFYITFGEGSATGTELPLNSDMSSLKVYPNPASDIINVQIEGYIGAVTLQIVDMQGIIVREFRNEVADKGRQKFEIPVNTLSKGLYMVNAIYTDGKRKTERVIIGR